MLKGGETYLETSILFILITLTLEGTGILYSLRACKTPIDIGSDATKNAVGNLSFKFYIAFFADLYPLSTEKFGSIKILSSLKYPIFCI